MPMWSVLSAISANSRHPRRGVQFSVRQSNLEANTVLPLSSILILGKSEAFCLWIFLVKSWVRLDLRSKWLQVEVQNGLQSVGLDPPRQVDDTGPGLGHQEAGDWPTSWVLLQSRWKNLDFFGEVLSFCYLAFANIWRLQNKFGNPELLHVS